jgi:hypothetical protein
VQNIAITYDAATTLRVQRLAALPVRVRVVPMPGTTPAGRNLAEWRDAASAAPTSGEVPPL